MRRVLPPLLFALAVPALAQSEAYVEQVGTSHELNLTQSVTAGQGHVAKLLQEGANSWASIEQVGGAHELLGLNGGAALQFDGSRLTLRQIGEGNRTFLEQRGEAMATVTQDGLGNSAFVEQHDGAFAEILQTGAGNWASVLQSGGLGNRAFVEQNAGGVADIVQTGAGNVARVYQAE